MKYLILFLLISCNQEKWKPSVTQKEYLHSLPLEGKAYMESCLCKYSDCVNYCIEKYRKLGITPVKEETGASVGKIAVGTAIGVGAAKLLLGK